MPEPLVGVLSDWHVLPTILVRYRGTLFPVMYVVSRFTRVRHKPQCKWEGADGYRPNQLVLPAWLTVLDTRTFSPVYLQPILHNLM